MKRKWWISLALFIVFLMAWGIAGALAQYSCPQNPTCGQKDILCPDTCGGTCSITAYDYTGAVTYNLSRSGGPCKTFKTINPDPDCYTTYACKLKQNKGLSCKFVPNYGNYCQGPKIKGNICESCSAPSTLPNPTTIVSYDCQQCGGG